MRVDQDVIEVLDRAATSGASLTLIGQLDRRLYERTAKAIEAAGGKWNRMARAHLFEGNAADAIEPIILTGEIVGTKQEFGQFDTPPEVARLVLDLASIVSGMRVLEPSAGLGNLAVPAIEAGAHVDTYEIDPRRAAHLTMRIAKMTHRSAAFSQGVRGDFLEAKPERIYDRVLMNPPFARQDDIRHVMHAARFLKPGGRLVAVMSSSVRFRTNKHTTEFRAFVEASPYWAISENLPEGSFKESGTGVNACIVAFNAEAE